MVASGHKHGWVPLFLNVLQWRPLDQRVISALLVGVTVLSLPEMAASELVESEHIGDWDLRNGTRK